MLLPKVYQVNKWKFIFKQDKLVSQRDYSSVLHFGLLFFLFVLLLPLSTLASSSINQPLVNYTTCDGTLIGTVLSETCVYNYQNTSTIAPVEGTSLDFYFFQSTSDFQNIWGPNGASCNWDPLGGGVTHITKQFLQDSGCTEPWVYEDTVGSYFMQGGSLGSVPAFVLSTSTMQTEIVGAWGEGTLILGGCLLFFITFIFLAFYFKRR